MNPQWYAGNPIGTDSTPMARLGTLDEIANATDFLLSDASGFVTGRTLHGNVGEIAGSESTRQRQSAFARSVV